METIDKGALRLPRFQRPFVWTDEQVVLLLDSILRGFHAGTILLWERWGLPPTTESFGGIEVACPKGEAMLVVDGQQRLGALYAATRSGRFFFHLQDGRFLVEEPGPWCVPVEGLLSRMHTAEYLEWTAQHAREHHLPRTDVQDAWATAHDVMAYATLTFSILSDWPLDDVVETFRRINTAGTPIDAEDLRTALQRAVEVEAP